MMYSWKRLKRSETVLQQRSNALYERILRLLVDSGQLTPDDQSTVSLLIEQRDWTGLMEWADSVAPQKYGAPAQYFAASQVSALVLKYPFTEAELPGLDPEARGLAKFRKAELRCARINARFRAYRILRRTDPYPEVTFQVREWFRRTFGARPNFKAIYEQCDFGPGASVGIHGDATNIGRKLLADNWSVTPTALPYALTALWHNRHIWELALREEYRVSGLHSPVLYPGRFSDWVRGKCVLVDHNKITFVPKTAKSARTIAIEPLLNGYVQKGVERFMKARLKRRTGVDLDLRDQKTNSLMAQDGSCGGRNPYCTIDLSAASDSMSTEALRWVLPSEWFDFLCQIRSPAYELGGVVTPYHKFTSMGNGFCFPLETALFAAITHAVSVVTRNPLDYRVYGDDIICRQSVALMVLELLKHYGFSANPDKTFLFGPFRESCGGDWYEGQDVRPVYLDERLDTIKSLFVLHNSSLGGPFKGSLWADAQCVLREAMPADVRFMRPFPGNPDSAFTVPMDVFMGCSHVRWSKAEQRWMYREILTTAVEDSFSHPSRRYVEYIAVLRGSRSGTPLALRRRTRTRVVWNCDTPCPSGKR